MRAPPRYASAMTHRRRPRLARIIPLAAFLACRSGEPPEAAPMEAPLISSAGDTTFVATFEPGLDGAVRFEERWARNIDTARLGTVTTAVLGHRGAVWFAVAGGSERAAVYRDDRDGALSAVVMRGPEPGTLEGPLILAALADGSILAVESATGRSLRMDSTGVARDSTRHASLAGVRMVVPDRQGGWFARGEATDRWWRHDPTGRVTDTLRLAGDGTPIVGLGRDGSVFRAAAGERQLERRLGEGPTVTARWDGPPLEGRLVAAHDAKGLIWIGSGLGDVERWRAFDRDGQLRFVVALASGETVLDRDGEYLLVRAADGGLRVLEVIGDTTAAR